MAFRDLHSSSLTSTLQFNLYSATMVNVASVLFNALTWGFERDALLYSNLLYVRASIQCANGKKDKLFGC